LKERRDRAASQQSRKDHHMAKKKVTVFTARKVRTMDPGRPEVDAVAVLDGRVLATGSLQSMQPWLEHYDVTVDEPLDGGRLHEFLDSLPKTLLRAKGILQLAEKPERRTTYQRVGARWDYRAAEPWGDESPRSSLVFIGPRGLLNRPALQAGLNACVAESRLV